MLNIRLELPDSFFDEEVRCDYIVSKDMKKVWAVELDLLNELMKVCDKYNLRYYAAGGTLLGAVRHHGYIPWDDDVDIMMFRKDFEKLNKVAPKEFKEPYFWQTEETDKGSMRGHAQLRNSSTTGILRTEYKYKMNFNQGIFIDIFPLDNIPDDEAEKERFFKKCNKLSAKRSMYRMLQFPIEIHFRKNLIKLVLGTAKKLALKHFTNISLRTDKAYNEWTKETMAYDDVNTKRVVMMPFFVNRWIHNRSDLKDIKLVPFEMLTIPIPVGFEHVLDNVYGNWRQFVKGTSIHGGVIFDTEKPYTEYLK